MKIHCYLSCAVVLATLLTVSSLRGQEYAITERGPNHRVWSRTVWTQLRSGRQVARTNTFVELQTGMHYLENGQWLESREVIEGYPGGAVARYGRNKVTFANSLATAGCIEVQTEEGATLRSHLLCLAYFDPATSQLAIVSEIKDTQGRLGSQNTVIYDDAFSSIKGTVRYTYTKAGLEQDIILQELPPAPSEFGLGPDATLQALTEYLDSPVPRLVSRRQVQIEGVTLAYDDLNLASLRLAPGKAFSIGTSDPGAIQIARHWLESDGRHFLIEEIPQKALVKRFADEWSKGGASLERGTRKAGRLASAPQRFPTLRRAAQSTREMLVAANPEPLRGVVLDWLVVSSSSNFTFQADQTYYVSGPVNLTGTTTFEASTIKFAPTNSPCLSLSFTPAVWKTSPYRPVVFTCREDATVGASIPGGTGAPQRVSATAISSPVALAIKNARFAHLNTAVDCNNNFEAWHTQFIDCGTAAALGINANLYNVLFAGCDTILSFATRPCGSSCPPVVYAQNVTADKSSTFMATSGSFQYNGALTFQNSILTAVTNLATGWPTDIATNSSCFFPAGNGVYAESLGGRYYLAEGSTNRNVGTTAINAGLAADLKKMTTYPPVSFAVLGITNNITFSPQVQRDTDVPDRGWHYNPLDYLIGWVWVTSPVSVDVAAGTAIGIFGTNTGTYGLGVGSGARLTSTGSPAALNRFVEYSLVQEQTAAGLCRPTYALVTDAFGGDPPPVNMRFSDFASSGQEVPLLSLQSGFPASFRDCQFHGGQISALCALRSTNCLFERVSSDVMSLDDQVPALRNNTFFSGYLSFYAAVTNSSVKDNLFDRTTVSADLTSVGYDGGFNAFVTNCDRILPVFSSDIILTAGPAYETAGFGSFYLPTNSVLIDSGSVTNAGMVGLYHFTTTTNQVKEGSSRLDIGFHGPALDFAGNAIDSDGDGVPDAIEDVNGDGLATGDPTPWNSYDSPNGLATGKGLKVFTPLK